MSKTAAHCCKTALRMSFTECKSSASTSKETFVVANMDLKLLYTFVVSSFHELQDLFRLCYENCTIDDNEYYFIYT